MTDAFVTWAFPTTIVFGAGAIRTAADHVRRLGAERALIVCDAGVVKVGIAERVRGVLDDGGIATAVFDSVDPNPTESRRTARTTRLASWRSAEDLRSMRASSSP